MNHPYPLGTRVVKTNSLPDDFSPNGSTGTILGGFGPTTTDLISNVPAGTYCYFVRWDSYPELWVAVTRVEAIGPVGEFADDALRFIRDHPELQKALDITRKMPL